MKNIINVTRIFFIAIIFMGCGVFNNSRHECDFVVDSFAGDNGVTYVWGSTCKHNYKYTVYSN